MNIKKITGSLVTLAVGATIFAPLPSLADCTSQQGKAINDVTSGGCDANGLSVSVSSIIDTLFVVVGAITVIIMIMGGIRYITSTGNAQRIQQAKDTVLYAIIGLVVTILARFIVGFVIGRVG